MSGEPTKIYAFINGGECLLHVIAVSEHGEHVAGHVSSSKGWARHDIGVTSDWKRDIYARRFPDGYELIWLEQDDPKLKELCDRWAAAREEEFEGGQQ